MTNQTEELFTDLPEGGGGKGRGEGEAIKALARGEYIRRLDREQAYPYERYDAWVDMGLPCLPFPKECSGLAPNRNGSRVL